LAWYAWAAGRDLIITDESHLDFAEVAMQRMPVCALAALAILSLAPHAVHAQAFTNGYIEWSLRPDAPRVPYDGAPFSEKYSYTASVPLLLGANPERLWYMYNMDRYDRAQQFGYALPPCFDPQPPPNPRPRRFGVGVGLFGGR
jgi:hypothetical protein